MQIVRKLVALQYKLWYGNGGQHEVAALKLQVAAQQAENAKLQARNPALHERWRTTTAPEAHPLLSVRPGDLEPWERP